MSKLSEFLIKLRPEHPIIAIVVVSVMSLGPAILLYDLHKCKPGNNDDLYKAIADNDSEKVGKLLAKGADPNSRKICYVDGPDYGGVTTEFERDSPLTAAAKSNQEEMVRLLLDAGANPNTPDEYGTPPLSTALQLRHPIAAAAIIAHGADPNRRDSEGFTPLMLAAQRGDINNVKALLAAGADPEARDRSGDSAATWASGDRPILSLLRQASKK
jgi:cytohesin